MLTSDQIVHAAVGLLDAEGLAGLNMRSLGKRLGAAATAVYWHIKTKDDLVRLAADAVWAEVTLPDLAAVAWRPAAEAMAVSMHEMLTRHPWLSQAFGSHLLYGPAKARHDDHLLAVYEQAGFAEPDADRAATAVFLFVLGSALGPAAQVSLNRRPDAAAELAAAQAAAAEIAASFPRLSRRLGTAAATEYLGTPEDSFAFGLRSLLDGIARRP